MRPINLNQYSFVFAANPDHPLEGFEGFALIGGEYAPVRVLAVSGNRIADGGLISEQKIQPAFLLEHVNSLGQSYIFAEYTGELFTAGVSRAEMFGLITRLENILGGDDIGVVSRSIASLITDRADMLDRVKAMREALK